MTAPAFPTLLSSFSSFPDLNSGDADEFPNVESIKKVTTFQKHASPTLDTERRIQNDDTNLPKVDLPFYSDRKGDPLNLEYGSLHTGEIPKYCVVGKNVMGLPNHSFTRRTIGKGIKVRFTHRPKISSLTSPHSQALLSKPASRLMLSLTKSTQYREVEGFIPLRRGGYIEKADESIAGSTYLSESEQDIASDNDSDAVSRNLGQGAIKQLEIELKNEPYAVDKWLSLLNGTLSGIPITSKNASKTRQEISLSILSRALAAHPRNATNKALRLAYLRAGEKIWHESKLKSEWEDALRIGGIEIYMEWLEWNMRQGNNNAGTITESVVRVLDQLGVGEEEELSKLRIFWRAALALKSAGYSERAMAMFQAQGELIFNLPSSIENMDFRDQLDHLEAFWDSEAPRLGEHGAKGWALWTLSSRTDFQLRDLLGVNNQISVTELDPYREWAKQELELDRKMIFSLRGASDSSDPFATILFGDIRSMLFKVKYRRTKNNFRLVWLSFLGLHLPGLSLVHSGERNWDDRWNLSHLTSPNYLKAIFPPNARHKDFFAESVAGTLIGREREHAAPFGPVRCWATGVSDPLDISSADLSRGIWGSNDILDVDKNLVRRLFSNLKMDQPDHSWDILYLAFEMGENPKVAIKTSKAFLSTFPESIIYWNAHAQLERLRGRYDEARKIYQTILSSLKPREMRNEVSRMWWNWAEMEWLDGHEKESLMVISRSTGLEDARTPVNILRAKRSLEDLVKLGKEWKDREGWIKLHALLELLTGHHLAAAISVFDKYMSDESEDYIKENLTTASLIMIYCYGTKLNNPMSTSTLRERAHFAIKNYPNNSIILGIFLEAEKGQGIWGRIKGMFGANGTESKDVARRIEEVWVAGWQRSTWLNEVERTRNGLSLAVDHERTQFSQVVWRVYIEFEIQVGELKRAKMLLFRAISECPLVKEIYLLAFGPLRSVFQVHELNSLGDMMVEKGLRLHRGLDEGLGGGSIFVGEADGREDSEDHDEIELDARERRRLMRY